MNDYRNPDRVVVDPRWQAETELIKAKTYLVNELARGIAIANNLARGGHEGAGSYAKRLKALDDFRERCFKQIGL